MEMKLSDRCWCGSGLPYKKCHREMDRVIEDYRQQGFKIPGRKLIKNETQITGIRNSGGLTREILDLVGERIGPGVTTVEVNRWVHQYTVDHGAYPAPLRYRGFPKSCCTSVNEVICHGIPSEKTVLKEGDIINVDVTTIVDGYYSDASRMYLIGQVDESAIKLVRVTKECLELGVKQVGPFKPLNGIGNVIETYANQFGFSVVRDLGGHGTGLQFHEQPLVEHFTKSGKGWLMLPGMVFTIEPMLNAGKADCLFLPDGWTVMTRDGSLSAQWEHTVAVTADGCEILT